MRAANQTANLAPCHCFSFCKTSSALDFYRRLPPLLNSTDSVWHKYLEAVYGGEVRLPFDLRTLNVFWYDSARWRARRPAPEVGLPISRCVGSSKPHEVFGLLKAHYARPV